MKRDRKSAAIFIFLGLLLIVIFAVGRIFSQDPSAFYNRYRVDRALDDFVYFCSQWWIPAGIIGIPMFLISFLLSLVREHKENQKQ